MKPTHARHVIVLAGALLYSTIVFLINVPVPGPMIQGDEGSYLAISAALAGFPNDIAGSYHSGYSMLISPAFWVADNPLDIWRVKTFINSVLYCLTIIGLWLVACRWDESGTFIKKLVAVFVVSAYPAWVIMVGYSFAQIAFIPAYIFTLLALYRIINGHSPAWFLLGVITGFLYWIHPAGLVICIATIVSASYVSAKRGEYMLLALLIATLASMIFGYQYIVTPLISGKMTISGMAPTIHYPSASMMFSPLFSLQGLGNTISHGAAQFFYLSIGTMGVLWVGLISISKAAREGVKMDKKNVASGNTSLGIFIWLSFLGMVSLGTLLFSIDPPLQLFPQNPPAPQRLDQWMYGRYVEGVIPPILLFGLLANSLRTALWSIPVAALGAFLFSAGFDVFTPSAKFNIPAFWQDFLLPDTGILTWLVSGCILIGIVAITPRKIGLAIIICVFTVSSMLHIGWHISSSKGAQHRSIAAIKARDMVAPGTCIGFDYESINSYPSLVYWYDFSFILFDYKLVRSTLDDWLLNCEGPIFSFDSNLDGKANGIYPIISSTNSGPTAWWRGAKAEALSHSIDDVSWSGETTIPSQVGIQTGSGIRTNGESGFLFYGPYVSAKAGKYRLEIMGEMKNIGGEFIVDMVDSTAGVTYFRFSGSDIKDSSSNALIYEIVSLATDVDLLEIRMWVNSEVELSIDGYKLTRINE